MKATEQYFPVVLFIMLYKVVLTFESVDEILMCDHLRESYWKVLSCGTLYCAVPCRSTFRVLRQKSLSVPQQMKATKQYFPVLLFFGGTLLDFCLKTRKLERGGKLNTEY